MRPAPGAFGLIGVLLSIGWTLPTCLPAQDATSRSQRPFETWTMLRPLRRGVTIWARNPTADTVAITRATLSACINIAGACGPTDLDLRLGPGDPAAVMDLEPKAWEDHYAYKVSWEWTIPSDLRMSATGGTDQGQLPFAVWVRRLTDQHELALMTRNTSTDTLIITHVLLSSCTSLATGCGPTPLRLRVAPGNSAPALTIRPRQRGASSTFDLNWEWTRLSSNR